MGTVGDVSDNAMVESVFVNRTEVVSLALPHSPGKARYSSLLVPDITTIESSQFRGPVRGSEAGKIAPQVADTER